MTRVDMRILGLGLIIASLVLGAGGVGYTSESRAQFGMTRIDEGGSCEAPTSRARLKLPRIKAHQRVLSLSNRGHNYGGMAQKQKPQVPASARD
jgi:hypothetical protein